MIIDVMEYKEQCWVMEGGKMIWRNTEWRNKEGQLHRTNGPAIAWTDGSTWWYLNGKRHREYGPAIDKANGYTEWYIDGMRLTKEEFNNRQKQ